MKNFAYAGLALVAGTGLALAGGIDRSGQDVSVIFEDGTYTMLSFGQVNPSVSGLVGGVVDSGDMAATYTQFALGYKQAVSDKLDVALIVDQPFGANVAYPTGTGYPLAGTNAVLETRAFTVLGQYALSDRATVLAGLRQQSVEGDIFITGGYTLTASDSSGTGWLLGGAYEIPEYALRVALVYNSAIDHTMSGTEVTLPSTFSIRTPQSVNLTAQSGIAEGTLLFGSMRWVDWDAFDITPNFYRGGALVSYDSDTFTWTAGIGRQFTENFAGSLSVGYEKQKGTPASNLAPTDGYTSIQLGGRYTKGNVTISGGVRYIMIGDAITEAPVGGDFADNTGLALGLQIGIQG